MKYRTRLVVNVIAVVSVLVLGMSGCATTAIHAIPESATQSSITMPAPQPLSTVDGPVPDRPYDVFYGPNYTDKVVLTFDDCPRSITQLRLVVAAAKTHDMGLVLAPTGQCLEQFGQNILDIMRQNGQYVINHSVSHPAFSTLSVAGITRELSAPGVVTNYGRPPYGDGYFTHPPSANVEAGYKSVHVKPWLWSVDTNDWQGGSAQQIVAYVINTAGKGDTVLMHMNHNAFNVQSILAIQRGLEQRGLRVCSAYPGVAPVMLPDSLPC